MVNKSKQHKKNEIREDEKTDLELHEMQLEQMDFEVVQKILSDYVAEEVTEDETVEKLEDDRVLELEVESLDKGLKKACELLDVPVKGLKYKITEKVLRNINGNVVEYLKIEFHPKLVSGQTQIKVSDDKLKAYFSVVFPKTLNDNEVEVDYLLDLIKGENITCGLKLKVIEKLVDKLKDNYDAVKDVLIAEGVPPVKGKHSEILYSVFSNIHEINYSVTQEKYLFELFNTASIDSIRENYFPVIRLEKNELIASTSMPGEGKNGENVFGEIIEGGKGSILFKPGKNVIMKYEEEKVNYYSKIFGYLEYEDGELNVHEPIWISEDFMEAYLVGLPDLKGKSKNFNSDEILDMLYDKEIKYGIEEEYIEQAVSLNNKGKNEFYLTLIAEGQKVKKGEDAKIDLFFETEKQAGKLLENGRMDYREISIVKVVKKNQLIAVKHFSRDGTEGINLKNESVLARKGEDKKLTPINNVKTVEKSDKLLYYSDIEGRVVLVGNTGISVNQLYEIKGNVDYSTGNIEFNGDVDVKGGVLQGFKVKAEGNISVKGMVNQGAELISNGNIEIKQGVIGRKMETKLVAKGNIFAQYLQNSIVNSESDVIIKDYIMNSIVKTKGKVITPDLESTLKGSGSIFGGEVTALKGIVANTIGSDLAKATKVTVGFDYDFDTNLKNLFKAMDFCEKEISKLSKFLRLGFDDLNSLKQRITGLPEEKRKLFINAFDKLNKVNKLKSELIKKREKLIRENDELAGKAEIIIKKDLFSRVNIQIGEIKTKTFKHYNKIKLKLAKNKKNVVFEDI